MDLSALFPEYDQFSQLDFKNLLDINMLSNESEDTPFGPITQQQAQQNPWTPVAIPSEQPITKEDVYISPVQAKDWVETLATNTIDPQPTASSEKQETVKNWWETLPPVNFSGSDLSTELYSLGMNIAAPKGSEGRTLGIVASAGSALLGAGRDFMSGFAMQKANNRAKDFYRQKLKDVNYTADDQFRDYNYLGATNTFEFGGTQFTTREDNKTYLNSPVFENLTIPTFEEGGGPGDPPTKKPNPDYEAQLKLKQEWDKAYINTDKYTKKLTGEELKNYVNKSPDSFKVGNSLFMPAELYVDPNIPGHFIAKYPDPMKEIEEQPTPEPVKTNTPATWNLATVIELKKADGSTEQVYVPKGGKYPTKGYSYEKFVEEMGPIGDYNKIPEGRNYNVGINNTVPGITFPNDYGSQSSFYKVAYEERQKELQKLQQQKPQMEYGGYKSGDIIEFEYGGQKMTGTFDRVENGKLFLK